MDQSLDDALRELMTYARSVSIVRTGDGRWQVCARTPHRGYAYTCHTDSDVAAALRRVCNSRSRPRLNRSDLFGEIYL